VDIDRPLSVYIDKDSGCKNSPTYIVLIKDGDVWRQYDAMIAILKKEAESAGFFLTSQVRIDSTTGRFNSTWVAQDIDFFRQRFPEGDEAAITVRVAAYLGGSTSQNAQSDPSTLPHSEFKIRFKAASQVSACANNRLIQTY
jgi:hypothetical protein